MFGDLGHGIIMALFALWMVLYENDRKLKRTRNEVHSACFFDMAVFAYNQALTFFSHSLI